MEFWLVEDGEKTGPHQAYEVRQRIEEGELSPDTLGWHRDQEEWLPLAEIPTFQGEFEKSVEPQIPVAPPPLPNASATWGGAILRFLARWVDLLLYKGITYVTLSLLGLNLVIVRQSAWFFPVFVLAFLLCETWFLRQWGSTPGKWLGGIKLKHRGKPRISWAAGMTRTLRVYVMGIGMTIPVLSVICQLFSLWFLVKKKQTLWDMRTAVEVKIPEFRPERSLLVFFTAFILMVGVSFMEFSAMMEATEHLPEPLRSQVEQTKKMLEEIKSAPKSDA